MGLDEIHSLDHVVLLCDDLDAMRTFYEAVMGFTVEQDRANWIAFRIGSTLLTLRPRMAAEGFRDGPATDNSAAVQLAFRVTPSAISTCHSQLQAAGADIVQGPTDLPDWRHRTIFFRDPEQNLLEIYAEY